MCRLECGSLNEERGVMKLNTVLLLFISLILVSAPDILAQNRPGAAETAEQLRAQLRDAQAEEADLQARAQQLDWDLKPENIERYFAGVGSTRPEELREQRRRLLQNERERVLARLEQLLASRSRLETAIVTADAQAYNQSAQGPPAVWANRMLGGRYLTNTRLFAGLLILSAIAGALALVASIHRRRRMRLTAS
jgi:uncharacterized protein YlxW (UPF0749 family)